MNTSTLSSLHEALLRLKVLYPDWRYGQLVSNVAAWAGTERPLDVCEVDDEAMLAAALRHLREKAPAPVAGERRASWRGSCRPGVLL